MSASRIITGITNLIVMLAAGILVGTGVWVFTRDDGVQCFKFLHWPMIIIGAAIFVVALLGFVGACCSIPILLWIYLLVLFLSMLALLVFSVLAFVVTNDDAGKVVSGQGFKVNKVTDFSSWLQKQVNDTGKWNTIRSCLQEADICDPLDRKYTNGTELYAAKLNPTQGGCCIPPIQCDFTFVNATYFEIPASGPAVDADPDCFSYSNNHTDLCFGCDTCKGGVLQNVRDEWRLIAQINIGVLAFMLVSYIIGNCAYRSSKKEPSYFGGYAKGQF